MDQDSNTKLTTDDVFTNLALRPYTNTAKTFDGYNLITSPTPQNVTLTASEPNRIILFYSKLTITITISSIDVC